MKNKMVIYNARTTGSFFLLAFFAYGLGRHFFESENISEKYIGALLIITNSFLVLFIGIFLRKTLQIYHVWVGNIYLLTRILEAIALASVVLNIIPTIHIPNDYGYFLAMLVLGIGSVPMCSILYKHSIVPSWLALWGIIGYAVFAFGFFMELMGKEWSMYLLGLGGLWEIIFGIWLMITIAIKQMER